MLCEISSIISKEEYQARIKNIQYLIIQVMSPSNVSLIEKIHHFSLLEFEKNPSPLDTSYQLFFDDFVSFLPELTSAIRRANERERKEIIRAALTSLNDSNIEEYELLQNLSKATLMLVCEEQLLSVTDITKLMVSEAKHFVEDANRWAYEVYGWTFSAYAIDYSISDIVTAVNQSSHGDVFSFLTVLKQIRPEAQEWEEVSNLLDILIEYIQKEGTH
ncbi:hypothetical protein [Fibrella forsythiae]|uniref:Uncharacterized protein n=1 Tax=Fibrella forsythiae TaxID=2817061 RepID=A0ABS3JRN0_9BACT|nr:hypothetical protein [Fibrella forsythiae]MBO0952669.1 hypothetical protein [Fibrella forsythiae]